MHPNERLLRREYDARAQRDDASLATLLTEAVVWHVPGRSAISGEYRGKDEVMEYVRRRRDLAADTVGPKDSLQVAAAKDRHPVQALGPNHADPPLGEGVRSRGSDRGSR
jgi:ketosteroid isomerase-like protein